MGLGGVKMIVTITNQKGGVAKTTTAHALAAGLKLKGYSVLSVDLDPQANLSYAMNVNNSPVSVLNVLTERISLAEAIYHSEQGEILPASSELAAAEKVLKDTGREFKLREAMESISDNYDYIVIDTPPSLNILTVNALTAAERVIIPAQADDFSLQGISELYGTISVIRRYTNPKLTIDGILLTRHNPRSIISRDMSEAIREAAEKIGGRLYDTYIRECAALKEAQAMRQDIYTYAPKSNAAIDYMAFVEEVIGIAVDA
jgi:chromosome partitioning protein